MKQEVELNKERFKKIYFSNKDRVYFFIKKFVKNKASTEDLLQECFMKLWNNLSFLQDDETIFSLLRTYAFNAVINHNKKEARRLLRENEFNSKQSVIVSHEDDIPRKQDAEQFWKTINTLSERKKYILMMKQRFGYTNLQLAEKLNVSTKAIEKHITEANKMLREKLKEG